MLEQKLEEQRKQLELEYNTKQREAAEQREKERLEQMEALKKKRQQQVALQERITNVLPLISEVNDICVELDRSFKFEVVL